MVVLVAPAVAEVSPGKFCRLLGPVSASQASFGVTPAGGRSIPRAPLEWIELERMELGWEEGDFELMDTPLPPLKAIVFPAPAAVPPILSLPLKSMKMPFEPLGTPPVPAALVPM